MNLHAYFYLKYNSAKLFAAGFLLFTFIQSNISYAQDLTLVPIGTYETGVFDESAAEIVKHDPSTQRLFVINSNSGVVNVLDIQDPTNPSLLFNIDVSNYGAAANSVDVKNGLVAIAVEADPVTDPGQIVIFDTDGNFQMAYPAGSLPDAVVFSPDGNYVLSADEGEPNDDYNVDPEGSITIVNLLTDNVQQATFTKFNPQKNGLIAKGVRIFGPNATVAQDLEPENLTISEDGTTAYVTLQENNAYAIVDIATATVQKIIPFGVKDHSKPENAMDVSDRDDMINITTWPVYGMYQPDGIDRMSFQGKEYIITANEGDSRDYDGFSEEVDVEEVTLFAPLFPDANQLQQEENLGRLLITNTLGQHQNGSFRQLYAFGARSFSIWRADNGKQIFDSGDDFERITAQRLPQDFNSTNDENGSFDSRSDAKGPEPEGLVTGEVNGRLLLFVGLERVGGIMVYDITNPSQPVFVEYVNNRNFGADAESSEAGDLGPEGLHFITADDSPNGNPLLVVGNEVSGTTTIFEIVPVDFQLQVLHASDLEGGVDAIQNAPNFAAIVESLEAESSNSILLSSGDNYIPGPFFGAAGDGSLRPVFQSVYQDLLEEPGLTNIREGDGRADITIMNVIGFDASAVGNHEFDAGTNAFGGLIGTDIRGGALADIRWLGAQFPYLSANLDFSADDNLNGFFTSDLLLNTEFIADNNNLNGAGQLPKLAPFTIIEVNGEMIGVVGATTQLVESISSTGDVEVIGPKSNDMEALAGILQPFIDQLTGEGIDKIIVVSHLQQVALEKELITKLEDVDVILAGGSDAIFANNDILRPGDVATEPYPFMTQDANGNPAVIVGTAGEYSYVGRLNLEFDSNGRVLNTFATNGSGIFATTDNITSEIAGPDPFAIGTRAELVKRITEALQQVINSQDGDIYGLTDVFLEGRREQVRTQETNFGNLSADANLAIAQAFDAEVQASIKNGGGIRAAIGEIVDNGDGTFTLQPPPANPITGKLEGQVSQLDIKNSLRFNNGLSILELSAQDLLEVIEHGVAATAPGNTPGQFPQIGGMAFSFEPDNAIGSRVQTLVLQNSEGVTTEIIAENGTVVGDPNRVIKIVTLDFLAGGGDSYPFPALAENRVDLAVELAGQPLSTFAAPGTEQDALASFLAANHSDMATAYNEEETSPAEDERIQNLNQRSDGLAGALLTTSIMPEENVIAYPVPMRNQLTVELPETKSAGKIRVAIQDLNTGRNLYEGTFDSMNEFNRQIHLDVSNIRKLGIYSLTIHTPDGKVLRRKVLK